MRATLKPRRSRGGEGCISPNKDQPQGRRVLIDLGMGKVDAPIVRCQRRSDTAWPSGRAPLRRRNWKGNGIMEECWFEGIWKHHEIDFQLCPGGRRGYHLEKGAVGSKSTIRLRGLAKRGAS